MKTRLFAALVAATILFAGLQQTGKSPALAQAGCWTVTSSLSGYPIGTRFNTYPSTLPPGTFTPSTGACTGSTSAPTPSPAPSGAPTATPTGPTPTPSPTPTPVTVGITGNVGVLPAVNPSGTFTPLAVDSGGNLKVNVVLGGGGGTGSGSTPIPYATASGTVLVTHNDGSFVGATPIPFPATYPLPSSFQTSFPTPVPYATAAGNVLLLHNDGSFIGATPIPNSSASPYFVNCVAGCTGGGSAGFPYSYTTGQSLLAASFGGFGGINPSNQFQPLELDANGFLIFSPTTPGLMNAQQSGAWTVTANAGSGYASVTGPGTPPPTLMGVQGNASGVPIPVTCTSGCGSGGSSSTPIPFATNGTGQLVVAQATTIPISAATTLPVSIATTVPVSLATSVAVTGTFFPATQPVSVAAPITVNTPAPCTAATCVLQSVNAAVTGYGSTHYPATSVVAGTSNTITSTANKTLYSLSVSWSVPSSGGVCYLTLYNSASPTVGTGFVSITPFTTSLPGIVAIAVPPTVGGAFSTAISYAITTTPTGSTACNTTASELWVEGWYI
jgi:hypothetical protein